MKYLDEKLGDSKNNNELAMAKIRIAKLMNLINEVGLDLGIDTSRSGYRIENNRCGPHSRFLSPILKNTDELERAFELMYTAILQFQVIEKGGNINVGKSASHKPHHETIRDGNQHEQNRSRAPERIE